MTREESTKIVDKIQIYRQSFLITNAVYSEWHRVLSDYDYDDVDGKLDEYFQNGDNFGRYPDVYYLTKYLKKHDEKLKVGVTYVRCHLCQKQFDEIEFEEHYERCSSVDYLCRMSEKHYAKKLNRTKMMNANKIDFEKYYWSFCEKLVDIMEDGLQKHTLTNAILTHRGLAPNFNLQEIYQKLQKG